MTSTDTFADPLSKLLPSLSCNSDGLIGVQWDPTHEPPSTINIHDNTPRTDKSTHVPNDDDNNSNKSHSSTKSRPTKKLSLSKRKNGPSKPSLNTQRHKTLPSSNNTDTDKSDEPTCLDLSSSSKPYQPSNTNIIAANKKSKLIITTTTATMSSSWRKELDHINKLENKYNVINKKCLDYGRLKKKHKDDLLMSERHANECQKSYNEMMGDKMGLEIAFEKENAIVIEIEDEIKKLQRALTKEQEKLPEQQEKLDMVGLKLDSLDVEITQLNDMKIESEKTEAALVKAMEKQEEDMKKYVKKRKRCQTQLDNRKTKKICLSVGDMNKNIKKTMQEKESRIKVLETELKKSEEEAKSKTLCSVCCCNPYNSVLSCSHTFCSECVDTITKKDKSIECPNCKAVSKSDNVIIFILPH